MMDFSTSNNAFSSSGVMYSNDNVDDNGTTNGLSERLLSDNTNNPFTASGTSNNSFFDSETIAVPIVNTTTDTAGSDNDNNNNNNNNITVNQVYQGEKQSSQYRDLWAGVLFICHVIVIIYLCFAYGIQSLNYITTTTTTTTNTTDSTNYTTTTTDHYYGGIINLCLLSSTIAILVSICILLIVSYYAQKLVECTLLFSIVIDIVLLIYCIVLHTYVGIGISIVLLVVAIWYTRSIWRRIPFAACNLETALTSIRTNGGVMFVGIGVTILINIVFMSLWLLAWLGVYVRYTAQSCLEEQVQEQNEHQQEQQQQQTETCLSHINPITVILFLLSYYWTSEVGKNIIHVTVSGIVGTWWFTPDEAMTFFSISIYDSFVRSTTYSFGSICLGSLVTATLQVINTILHYLLNSHHTRYGRRTNELLFCILECLTNFLQRLVKYFNKWSYVYIGLYGYDYLTAGRKVMDLFRARGWTTLINDDLVSRVLFLLNIVIGILTGCVSLMLSNHYSRWLVEFNNTSIGPLLAFIIPFVIGISISTIMTGIVASAVDTVIVAFCEAPLEFERNHPGLHRQMITSYSLIYPEEFGFASGFNQQSPL